MDLVALAAGEILDQVAVPGSGRGGQYEMVATSYTDQRIDAGQAIDGVAARPALQDVVGAAAGNLRRASAVGYGEVLDRNKARVATGVETATAQGPGFEIDGDGTEDCHGQAIDPGAAVDDLVAVVR